MLGRYEKILKSLFKKVYLLSGAPLENRLLSLEIQKEILRRIIVSENRIRKNKEQKKLLKIKLSNRENSKDKSKIIKKKIKRISNNLERQYFLLWAYRTIGDSVAFIYGDRWDLKQYVFKQDAGFISGKVGLKLERNIFKAAFKHGATVVMNDLTNTMRHGDITLFRPDLWPDGGSPALFIEVKSGNGGNKKRARRQEAAIKKITDYIYSDKRVEENGQYLRVNSKNSPIYYNDKVVEMAKLLKHERWAHKKVEAGLHYLMIDCSYDDFSSDDILSSVFKNIPKPFMLSVNDLKKQNLGYYPFPLSIRDEDILFRFYNGEFVFFVILDIDHINKTIASKGLYIECTSDDDLPWKVSYINPSNEAEKIESYVGYHPIGRLASEFISLDWIINNVILGLQDELKKSLSKQLASSKNVE